MATEDKGGRKTKTVNYTKWRHHGKISRLDSKEAKGMAVGGGGGRYVLCFFGLM